jgi:hypothetical protein
LIATPPAGADAILEKGTLYLFRKHCTASKVDHLKWSSESFKITFGISARATFSISAVICVAEPATMTLAWPVNNGAANCEEG